jgi:aspartyl-tRNA(Asn)/glutamyl-tRNA(Gln) amidotransferase subunit C
MTEKIITKKDVEYVAKLARLAISSEEAEKMQVQLERILGHVSQLKAKNTDNVAPTAHPLDVANVWREDRAEPFPAIPDLLKNAPETEETFFKVKKVIE